jgi:glycosyltransferase involved in cell wall biosynthesis
VKNPAAPLLILIDSHTLNPHTVQGFQFLARAASFAEHWPGAVQFWLPGPAISEDRMLRATALDRWPENLLVRFGPAPQIRLGPIRIKTKSSFRAWVSKELRQLIGAASRPILYFRTLKLPALLGPLLTTLGVRYFFEPHEVFFESSRNPARFRVMEENVYARARHLYPISSGLAASLEKEFALKDSLTIAPLGHSGANLQLPPYDPAADARLLFTGSLLRWKGLETVLTAAHSVSVPFDIVGDAGGRDYYENYCRQRGYSNVTFHGHVPPEDLSKFYLPGTICVLPLSRANIAMKYTSPLKLFEYLASGRPVLAGDVPSVREIVQHKTHAILLEPENTDVWTRGLRDLLSHRAAAADMANHARELAMACTWSNRAKPLVESFLAHA